MYLALILFLDLAKLQTENRRKLFWKHIDSQLRNRFGDGIMTKKSFR